MTGVIKSEPWGGKQIGLIALLIAVPIALLSGLQPLLGLVVPLGLIAIVMSVAVPDLTTWVLLFGLMALSEPIAIRRYDIGIGLFGADLTLPLLFGIALRMAPAPGSDASNTRRAWLPVIPPILVMAAYGLVALAWAFGTSGHDVRNVIGDFRRYFLYPLILLVGVYTAHRSHGTLRRIVRFALVAVAPVAVIALFRIATGTSYRPAQFHSEFRAFSFYDSTVLYLPLVFLLASAALNRDRRVWTIVGAGFIGGLEIASGYRLAWALVLVAPVLTAALLAIRTHRYRALTWLLLSQVAVLVGIIAVVLLNAQLASVWAARFNDLVFTFENLGLSWRILSWTSALTALTRHPLLGVGIGDVHTFWIVNSAGLPTLTTHTPHNILISIVYQTGLIGLAIFLVVHVAYMRLLWRSVRRVPLSHLAHLVGIIAFYVAALAVSNLQPFLDDPGGAMILYLMMGLTIPQLNRWAHAPLPRFDKGNDPAVEIA